MNVAIAIVMITTRALGAQTSGAVLPRASVLPVTYVGNCPVPVEFIGHITASVPGTLVDYQWERSDGSKGKVLHAQIGKAPIAGAVPDSARRSNITEPIPSDKWRLALPGKTGKYSETLHILTPFDIRSAPAVVTVACRD